VRRLVGLAIEAEGPDATIGEICDIATRGSARVRAEVVGFRDGRLTLMPYGQVKGIGPGCDVIATDALSDVAVGDGLLGRVVDAFGEPIDGSARFLTSAVRPIRAEPQNPLGRRSIERIIETGVKAIDAMLTIGEGQRVGIFAGSGVGKSTLLGTIARSSHAEINVVALIGERGREVREFIDKHLGEQGLKRSVVVAATSDQSALARVRAAYTATAIAEHFRDQGARVMLMMDSVTRFAMARREIGLAAGEPPTARGYTPSVFAELPELCERSGTSSGSGTITALYTVLVEGDDFNEPISDTLRATLDGHIVLTRQLAQQGHYPAIDVLQSASRLFHELVEIDDRELVYRVRELMAVHQRNRQLVDIGAYRSGSNPEIDQALRAVPMLTDLFRQGDYEPFARKAALRDMASIIRTTAGG